MNRPADNVEKQFNDDGIFFLQEKSIHDAAFKGDYVGVQVAFAIPDSVEVSAPDFSVSVVNKREVALLFTDWFVSDNDGQKYLSFKVYQRVPENIILPLEQSNSYMSFLDLCFYGGNEKIPDAYGEDIPTKPFIGSIPKDLGWALPSRFLDPLIPALGKIDDSMLGGNMQHALLYGPITFSKGE